MMAATGTGVIMGTAPYMSPEQARGQSVDKRSDIWSFGCVLYEMLAGKRTFDGATVTDVMAAIVGSEPDWNAVPVSTPPAVQRLLRRSLAKDAGQRLRDLGDARLDLADALYAPPEEQGGARSPRPFTPAALGLAGLAVVVAFIAGFVFQRWLSPEPEGATASSFSISLPTGAALAVGRAIPQGIDMRLFDLSHDGRHLVFVADRGSTTQLYLATVGDIGAMPLVGTEGATHPFFSPDGRWVGYVSGGELRKLSLAGGSPEIVLQASGGLVWGAAWGEDGIYLVDGTGDNLTRVPADGGAPVDIGGPGVKDLVTFWPVAPLPGGRGVLVTASPRAPISGDYRDIMVWSAISGEWTKVIEAAGYDARFVPSGHLVYVRAGALWAVRFDLERLEATGEPQLVLDEVRTSTLWNYTQFAFSDTGTLVYTPGGDTSVGVPTWVDRAGNIDPVAMSPGLYGPFALSPDGRQLAIQVAGPTDQVQIYDLTTGIGRALTRDANNGWPIWSPDGGRVVYSSTRSGSWGLYVQSVDGTGDALRVLSTDRPVMAYSWSPREDLIAHGMDDGIAGALLSIESGTAPARVPYPETFSEFGHSFSPDGRWLAYTSFKDGPGEIWVRPFPELHPEYKVSSLGGVESLWSHDGTELFYREQNRWIVSEIRTEPSFSSSPPEELFQTPFVDTFDGASWDRAPDGRFLVIRPTADDSNPTELRIVLNWFDELKRLVPTDP